MEQITPKIKRKNEDTLLVFKISNEHHHTHDMLFPLMSNCFAEKTAAHVCVQQCWTAKARGERPHLPNGDKFWDGIELLWVGRGRTGPPAVGKKQHRK